MSSVLSWNCPEYGKFFNFIALFQDKHRPPLRHVLLTAKTLSRSNKVGFKPSTRALCTWVSRTHSIIGAKFFTMSKLLDCRRIT